MLQVQFIVQLFFINTMRVIRNSLKFHCKLETDLKMYIETV